MLTAINITELTLTEWDSQFNSNRFLHFKPTSEFKMNLIVNFNENF